MNYNLLSWFKGLHNEKKPKHRGAFKGSNKKNRTTRFARSPSFKSKWNEKK